MTQNLSTSIIAGLVAVIVLLLGGMGSLLLIVRRTDMGIISSAKESLDALVQQFATLREELAKHYVTKADLRHVEAKIDLHLQHSTPRGERRMVEDAEDP